MCVFNRPSPPPLPEPTPIAPRPEPTARRVVLGQQRTEGQRRRKSPTQRTRRRLGTASLQIPLLDQGQVRAGNLNY